MTDDAAAGNSPAPKHAQYPQTARLAHGFLFGLIAAIAIAIVAVVLALNARSDYNDAIGQRDHANGQAGTLYTQVASAGATPSVTPSGAAPASVIAGPTGQRGATGEQGQSGPGPSDAQVARVVRDLAQTQPALFATPVQFTRIVAAVRAVCGSTDCRGTRGPSGSPGASGVSGQPGAAGASGASGAAGTGPTDAQIQAALATACGGSCIGPQGPPGPSGATGPAGPPGPPCPTGFSQATVTPGPEPIAGPAYVQCQADPTTGSSP